MEKRPDQVGQMQPFLRKMRYSVIEAQGMIEAFKKAVKQISPRRNNAVCFALDATHHAYVGSARTLIGYLISRDGEARPYSVVDDWLALAVPNEYAPFSKDTRPERYEQYMSEYRRAWVRYIVSELQRWRNRR